MSGDLEEDPPLDSAQLAYQTVLCYYEPVFEETLARDLFLAHPWLFESNYLLNLFIDVFQEKVELREAVCMCVAEWIRRCPQHFEADPPLCASVVRLRTISDGIDDEIRDRLDVSNLPSYAWMRSASIRQPVVRQISLSFDQWSPQDLSTSLSHIDYRVLCRISMEELKTYVQDGNLSRTPVLERSISVFNNLTHWVQLMILSKATPKDRAEVITKFVNVGKILRKINNFNTLMAVIGGVTHSNVARLSKTHNQLVPNIKQDLTKLTNLLSNQGNFAEYRQALIETGNQFRIPIMGVHLKDLIVSQCTGDAFHKTNTISKKKLNRLAGLLSNFMIFNQRQRTFPDANLDLINTLKVALDVRYNEEDIYELSHRREQSSFMNFESSARAVVFADWASGVSALPDPDTVDKHVAAMVDAVFKHYDHDRDGYISKAEFRQIAGNFPLIDPFVAIDLDRDGQISREELRSYFVKANQDSLAFRKSFKHDFRETTFLTPTSCGHCQKLLWGLIRQGWKCKDCGLAVHTYCKANAVAECRRKTTSGLVEWLSPRSSTNSSFRAKLFLNYKFRTVSTVSGSPSPSPEPAQNHGSPARTSRLRMPLPRSSRPQSEGVECYASQRSPDEENCTATLACEEVFEEENSVDRVENA